MPEAEDGQQSRPLYSTVPESNMRRFLLNSALLAAALSLFAASGAAVAEEPVSISEFTRLVYAEVMTTAPGFTFSRNIGIVRACGQKELASEAVEASRPMLFHEVVLAMRRNQPSAGLSTEQLVEVLSWWRC